MRLEYNKLMKESVIKLMTQKNSRKQIMSFLRTGDLRMCLLEQVCSFNLWECFNFISTKSNNFQYQYV